MSSGMCSITSEMITTSKDSSGNGRASASPSMAVAVAPGRGLAGLLHRREPLGDLADLLAVPVEGHDLRAAPVALEGVPAGAAAQVEHAVARGEREAGEVDGQHVALLSRSVRSAGRACGGRGLRDGAAAAGAAAAACEAPAAAAGPARRTARAAVRGGPAARDGLAVALGGALAARAQVKRRQHPLAARPRRAGPAAPGRPAAGRARRPARPRRRAARPGRSRRRARRPRGSRRRWWRPAGCRWPWPRRRAARSPRTARARRRPAAPRTRSTSSASRDALDELDGALEAVPLDAPAATGPVARRACRRRRGGRRAARCAAWPAPRRGGPGP